MQIVSKPVSNFTVGRGAFKPEAIVIHIAEGYLAGAHSWFNNPAAQASSHYMIGRNGEIWQFVQEKDTAWHAGAVDQPNWNLLKPGVNPNLYTIGIEHEGFTSEPWGDAQYNASAWLIGQICQRWDIPLDREHIIGHGQINSINRKWCPGIGVDFAKLIQLASQQYEDPEMIKELQAQVAQLNTQIAELRNQVGNLQLEKSSLNERVKNLQTQLTEAQKLSNSTLAERNLQLTTEVTRLQEQTQRLSSQVNDLQRKNRELQDTSAAALTNYSFGQLAGALGNKIFPKAN